MLSRLSRSVPTKRSLFYGRFFPTPGPGPLKRIFQHAQEEAALHAAEHPELDRKVVVVLVTTCVMLTLQNYVFRDGSFDQVPALLDGSAPMTWPIGSMSGPAGCRIGNWPNCFSGWRAA